MDFLVSVIIPIYNSSKFLHECIYSVINQTHKNIEILLINDGSTDDSLNICNQFRFIDHRIKLFNQSNLGVSNARNCGLDNSKGDFIYFLDSDDYINEDTIHNFLVKILETSSDVCILSKYTIRGSRKFIKNLSVIKPITALKEFLSLRFPTSLWAFFYSKVAISNLRLNTEIHFFEDLEFNFRIITSINLISILHEKPYFYRSHSGNTNNQYINSKRLTSLNVINLIKNRIESNYASLNNYSYRLYSHILVSIILSVLKSIDYDKYFFIKVYPNINRLISNIFLSFYVNFSYKIIIFLYFVNIKILRFVYYNYKKIKTELIKQ
jgi:glycosyltransferase involved in cell wall biosynthesis